MLFDKIFSIIAETGLYSNENNSFEKASERNAREGGGDNYFDTTLQFI